MRPYEHARGAIGVIHPESHGRHPVPPVQQTQPDGRIEMRLYDFIRKCNRNSGAANNRRGLTGAGTNRCLSTG